MNSNWRHGILYVTTIGMESCWLYALLALLNKQVADERLSILWLLFLYPLSFVFNRLLLGRRWPAVYTRGLSGLAWLIGMLLMVKIQLFSGLTLSDPAWLLAVPRSITEVIHTFNPELLVLISTAVIWWLGWRLSCLRGNFNALVSEFQFGLVVLLITFFVASQLKVDLPHPVYLVLTFFLFALLGISIAHALEGASWLSGLYQGHWSGILLVSISLVLILGLLISSVITPDLLQLCLTAIKWVWGLIMKVLIFLASLIPPPEPGTLPPGGLPLPAQEPPEEFQLWTIAESVKSGLRIAFYILWLGLITLALWRISSAIFGWLRRRLSSMSGAEFETLPGAFKADLLSSLKYLLLKLLRLRFPFRRAKTGPILPEIASVRQIYRRLLHWAAAGGSPRLICQTPREYLGTLETLLPEAKNDLVFITQQYVSTRYGGLLPTKDELHQLNQSWHRVRQNRLKNRR